MTTLKLKRIAETTVWDYYNTSIDNVGFRKGSNLNKTLRELYQNGERGMITVFVEAIGRSQHSASRLGIFRGVTNQYYVERHAEYKLETVVARND